MKIAVINPNTLQHDRRPSPMPRGGSPMPRPKSWRSPRPWGRCRSRVITTRSSRCRAAGRDRQGGAGGRACDRDCLFDDDTGLDAARALAGIPVIGICEAALSATSFIAQRFSVVTTMERSRLPVEHLVHRYGMGSRCKVRAADVPVLSLEIRIPTPATGCAARYRQRSRTTGPRRSCSAVPAWRI